jgi:hypothetical protein
VFREGINTGLTPVNTLFVDAVGDGEWRGVDLILKDTMEEAQSLLLLSTVGCTT